MSAPSDCNENFTIVSSSPLYDEWLWLCTLKLPEVGFRYENQDFRVLFLSLLKKISAVCLKWAFLMAQWVKNPPASAGDRGEAGSIPGLGGSFREGNGNPLQHSCWQIPWREEPGSPQSVGVTKSWPWLSHWRTEALMCLKYLFWNQLHFSFWAVDSELEGRLWCPEWGQREIEVVEHLKTPSWYSGFFLCPPVSFRAGSISSSCATRLGWHNRSLLRRCLNQGRSEWVSDLTSFFLLTNQTELGLSWQSSN